MLFKSKLAISIYSTCRSLDSKDEVSRMILELQKDRFFDDLTAKYWNSSLKGSCIRNDDSEGITLESLGGVFIATLVGLGELSRKEIINYMLNCP